MRKINVSIVYATAEKQWLKERQVARGTTVSELLELSGFMDEIEELKNYEIEELQLGIYSQKAKLNDLLEEGDRLEIYRHLTADPKEVRRQLALLGKSMGKK